ncbi:radical SAM/SPASM domain-containing protein [Neobacillus mesonae]|uniref:radical SAM/SPASM domain-containing protein n=1 Tax=Neobacillus mesonae TaxID=1193713 RepID=UPI0025739BDC|nr:SPASM domain-containing protein [Neobacillus mesonae]
MQLSNYLRFETNHRHYLYHGLTGNIIHIDKEAIEFIDFFETNGDREGDSYTLYDDKLKDQVFESYQSIIKELSELEILSINRNENVGRFSQTPGAPQNTGNMPVKTLVFHLVNECNLRCTYCYADGGEYGAPQKYMSQQTAKQAVDYLLEHSYHEKSVTIVLFGGEPFLNWDVLRFIVEYSSEEAEKRGKKVSYSLTTNGTLLSQKKVEFLNKYSVGVSVSMDGSEEYHDRNRPFAGGQGSYQTVNKNVSRLIESERTAPVGTRVTVAKGFEEIEASLKHLLSKGFYEVGFAPVTESDMSLALNDVDLQKLLDQFEEISDVYVKHAIQNEYLGFSNLTNLLRELHNGENKAYGCGAGLGFFAVSPEGNLYLCHRFNEDERFKMGDIYKGVNRKKQKQMLEELHVDNKVSCKTCSLKHICSGGCYYEAMERQGDFRKPNAHYCNWMHDWITIGLKAYVRIAEQNPGFLEAIAGDKVRCSTS